MNGGWPHAKTWKQRSELPHVVILGAGASRAACQTGDKNGLRLPLMCDLLKLGGVECLLKEHNFDPKTKDFEAAYSRMPDALRQRAEQCISEYFAKLELPDTATVYDQLVIALRGKDLIATFNWDPLLLQARERNRTVASMPRLAFLHGNVGLSVCAEHGECGVPGAKCRTCGKELSPSKLLYPVEEKNYEKDPHIKQAWDELDASLEKAYFLTIFGYSAPVSDQAAILRMKGVWNKNYARDLAQIEIVNTSDPAELERTWRPFVVREHYDIWRQLGESYLAEFPRRTCEAFASATLNSDPWESSGLPEVESLADLHNAIGPLIDQERESQPPYDSLGPKTDWRALGYERTAWGWQKGPTKHSEHGGIYPPTLKNE